MDESQHTTPTAWQVSPDGVTNPISKAGESSGRRTITPPDVWLAPERLSPAQQRAWAYIAQHGIEAGWPRPAARARLTGKPAARDSRASGSPSSRFIGAAR